MATTMMAGKPFKQLQRELKWAVMGLAEDAKGWVQTQRKNMFVRVSSQRQPSNTEVLSGVLLRSLLFLPFLTFGAAAIGGLIFTIVWVQVAILFTLFPFALFLTFLSVLIPPLGLTLVLAQGFLGTLIFLPFVVIRILWSVFVGREDDVYTMQTPSLRITTVNSASDWEAEAVRRSFLRKAQSQKMKSAAVVEQEEEEDGDWDWRQLRDFDRRLGVEMPSTTSKRPLSEWTAEEVAEAAGRVGLSKFKGLIVSSGLDGRVVCVIREEDLMRELGVTRFGDRKRLMLFFGELRDAA